MARLKGINIGTIIVVVVVVQTRLLLIDWLIVKWPVDSNDHSFVGFGWGVLAHHMISEPS